MAFVTLPPRKRSPVPLQLLLALAGGLALFLFSTGLLTGGYELLFAGRIFPGISMAGVDLSSLTPAQATTALQERLSFPTTGKIVFRDGNRVWVATPTQLGMVFDATTNIQRAYQVGRQSNWIINLAGQVNAWETGMSIDPIVVIDEQTARRYLVNIESQIDQPMVETDLHLEGAQVVYTAGHAGRLLNVDATLAGLLTQLSSFQDGDVPLVIDATSPQVLDASAQAASLRQILSAPLTLTVPDPQTGDPGPWLIDQATLAGILTVQPVQTGAGPQYQVVANGQALVQWLGQIAPSLERPSKNARFYFDDASRQLVLVDAAVTGRELDVTASQDAILQKLLQGEHSIPLVLAETQPAVPSNASAASLGITTLVSSYTSYFRGSSQARLQNIKAAASRFHGLLIPPNATFSMGDAIGDISLNNGYAEALIIFNGQTITGVGGGVCQVSTTLFRAAFYGGYPIVERHEHAYRVYYYEQTARGTNPDLAGLDATVYFPLVDLKFTNDRPYWLLMETYFHADTMSLEWKFYSTDDGRTVVVQPSEVRNVVSVPDPVFEENPSLGAGEISQMDWWYEDGADITITRVVSLGGQVLDTYSAQTHYDPHPYTCQYGPGTVDPEARAAQLGLCNP